MSIFSAAIDAIFTDANMAADATWQVQGAGPVSSCRIIRKSPDSLTDYGGAQIRSETTVVDVRVSEWADPRAGDTLVIGAEAFVVQGRPVRDRERLVWTLNLRQS